jgi:Flp pilus assembly protein protease CpaA
MIFNILVVLITLIVCSYHDLKKKTVPKWALYPMVLIGFFLNLIVMGIYQDPFFKFTSFFIALIICMIGLVCYDKKWELIGGADILLFLGIMLMTPVEFMIPEFYLGFFLFTCLCGVAYYAVMKLAKKSEAHIKFVPCILVGYAVTVFGLFGPQILAAIL